MLIFTYVFLTGITMFFTKARYNFSENTDPRSLCQLLHDIPALAFSNPASYKIRVRVKSASITATGEYICSYYTQVLVC